jgi:hypothetical protein
MLLLVGWVAYGQDEEGEESLIWVSFFLVGKEINKRFTWDLERERERERERAYCKSRGQTAEDIT